MLVAGVRSLLLVGAGLLAGWWVYVPLHELLHALGCWLAGGEVTRLEIAPLYGARWLARIFPFVTSGGEYAGRLSGFDTHGSDWVYALTDLAPFGLTLFPGFWWLRRAARAGRPIAFGAALPAAFGPVLSLTGDAYELGSLAVVHLPFWHGRRVLVGDDLASEALGGGRARRIRPAPGTDRGRAPRPRLGVRLDTPRGGRRDAAGGTAAGAAAFARRPRGGIRLG